MKRTRRKARQTLTLLEGAVELPAAPAPLGDPDKESYVIQNIGLGAVTRLVLLAGDPLQPFQERPGIATVEVARGHLHDDDTRALIDDLLVVLHAHGRKQWELELRTRDYMRRGHLELVP